ncbi:MAG: sugar kinase, partial [Alphaproteobacteria bacterium]|nr:sugar kinase [Alphaproteobacteria bacterium]
AGERSFYYWRDSAPARDLFCRPEADAIRVAIEGCDLIYFSGISLSLYGDDGRAALFRSLTALRRRGGRVAFDSNYRPRNWPDIAEARAAFHAALGHADMALCGADDFRALFGYGTASRVIDGCRAAGVREIVVKDGSAPATVSIDDRTDIVPVAQPRQPVDTTAAGDSFNAAYLAARLAGAGAVAAARDGHLLAGAVIMHPGAIMPRAAMPAALMGATASKRKEPS